MTKILNVFFHEKLVGTLDQDPHGEIHFTYSENWLQQPDATPISCSLPLQSNRFNRKECHAFFSGMLPEEGQRKLIAKNLSISAHNDFSMLEKIGGECAGALTFLPLSQAFNAHETDYHAISKESLADILKELPYRPLLAGDKDIRLSLAGVQDKLAIYIKENNFFIPLNHSPSTHILKPGLGAFEGIVFNEAFCLNLANEISLPVAEAEINKTDHIDYLLVKRYDRFYSSSPISPISRLHQEDFCQALGIPPEQKYQKEGGPTLKQCFDLVRRVSTAPILELDKLLNAVIFNFLIGNCDAHGKNFSLLYNNGLRLAPLYDLVCTLYYKDLNKKMAMKIGGEYSIHKITRGHFDKLAEEIGFAKPVVQKRINDLIDAVLEALKSLNKLNTVQENIAELIQKRCEEIMK